jgi:hypothetical protein
MLRFLECLAEQAEGFGDRLIGRNEPAALHLAQEVAFQVLG